MKNILIIACFLLSEITTAQEGKNGVYLTAEDFSNRNLTHASADTRLKLYEFFNKDFISVKCTDCSYTYFKKDVFGYVDKEGNPYRFYSGDSYLIINPSEKILFYKKPRVSFQKGQAISHIYFFSKDATSKLMPLTIDNLLIAFEDNLCFQNILEIHFNNQSSLLEYDNIHKQYKINRLLEISKNEKTLETLRVK